MLNFGGIERRLINLAHIQDENEWFFCSIGKGGAAEKEIKRLGKNVKCFDVAFRIPSFVAIWKLYFFFKKYKPDVVHSSGAEANFHGIIAARLAKVPCIVGEEIGVPDQSIRARKVFSFLYNRYCKSIVGNSHAVTDYLTTYNGVIPEKVKKIANPLIFPNLNIKKNKREGSFRIVSVSRLDPIKNIESVIKVLKILVDEGYDIVYWIIGEGDHRKKLEELVVSNDLSGRIVFWGFRENVYEYLCKSDLFILSSHSEGFSNSLVEAMYSGTPVLSTSVGAATEIIEHGVNGWLTKPRDDNALYRTLKNEILETSQDKRIEIGENARMFVRENFSLDQHVVELMNIYR